MPAKPQKRAPRPRNAVAKPTDLILSDWPEIDGGVTSPPLVAAAGANVLVAGSAVFKGGSVDSYRSNVSAIRKAAEEA